MSDYNYDDSDSGNDSCNEETDDLDDDGVLLGLDPENHNNVQDGDDFDEDDYPFRVLGMEEIMHHMIDSIKEVRTCVI